MINPDDFMIHVVLWRPLFPEDCDMSVLIIATYVCMYMYIFNQFFNVFSNSDASSIYYYVSVITIMYMWLKTLCSIYKQIQNFAFHHRRVCSILPLEKNLYYFKVQLVLASIICFNRILSIRTRIFHNQIKIPVLIIILANIQCILYLCVSQIPFYIKTENPATWTV